MKPIRNFLMVSFCLVSGFSVSGLADEETEIRKLKEAIKQEPGNARHHFQLGWYMQKRSFDEKAIESYKRAIELQPGYTSAHINLANIYLARDDFNNAHRHYKIAVDSEPGSAPAHYNFGTYYLKRQDLANALLEFERTIQLDNRHKSAHLNAATIYITRFRESFDRQKLEAARNHLIEAGRLDPGYAHVYYNLGIVFELENNNGIALQYYREAERLYSPQDPFLHKTRERISYLTNVMK